MINFTSLTTEDRKAIASSPFSGLRASEIPGNWKDVLGLLNRSERIRAVQVVTNRPCFICSATGCCGHRESDAMSAELEAIERRLRARGVVA